MYIIITHCKGNYCADFDMLATVLMTEGLVTRYCCYTVTTNHGRIWTLEYRCNIIHLAINGDRGKLHAHRKGRRKVNHRSPGRFFFPSFIQLCIAPGKGSLNYSSSSSLSKQDFNQLKHPQEYDTFYVSDCSDTRLAALQASALSGLARVSSCTSEWKPDNDLSARE